LRLDFSLPVLVVDDVHDHARLVSTILQRLGFQSVEIFHDGNEVLQKLRERRRALVISDWNMRPMSGYELLKQIRSDKSLAHVRFIMVSGESEISHVIAAKRAEADSYLVKPFNSQALKTKIEEALANRK
jgi:two-component system, chemotaxis family, chemotaxis protein CheY